MPPPLPFTPTFPVLSSTTSFQIASYAFTSLLLHDQPEDLRSWAPPAAASAGSGDPNGGQQEHRKGNAIGSEGQLYYIVLVRMVLLVRVASFVAPRTEAEIQASVRDARELLDAAAAMGDGGKSGVVTFGAFIAIVSPSFPLNRRPLPLTLIAAALPLAQLVYTLYTLRSKSDPSKELLEVAEKLFSARSVAQDPLAAKGLQVLQLLKEKAETVARESASSSHYLRH
jgi:hypothetical protein